MSPQPRIPFHFHAEGHALSAEFRHPGRVLIKAQASASLPTIGGHARAHADHFFHSDFVSFRTAHTEVTGRWIDADTVLTTATTTIEDLDVLQIVTADRIVSRLVSTHKRHKPEGHIVSVGSEFHNLRVHGHLLTVALRHKLLSDSETFDDLRKKVESREESERIRYISDNKGVAICSLVENIQTDLEGVDPKKHVFRVPNFGKIALAEVFAEPGRRVLTMLRLELGSPHVADITAAEASTNGKPWPPSPLSS
ncbi:MAG TPA: hypothetical protein VJN89_21245 [Candidatus Acidoferrum sp.]|nr:hypothetical protein [Candidatus Acidoferrum sp.]